MEHCDLQQSTRLASSVEMCVAVDLWARLRAKYMFANHWKTSNPVGRLPQLMLSLATASFVLTKSSMPPYQFGVPMSKHSFVRFLMLVVMTVTLRTRLCIFEPDMVTSGAAYIRETASPRMLGRKNLRTQNY